MKKVTTFGQIGPCYEIRYSKRMAQVFLVSNGKRIGGYKVKDVILGRDNGPELGSKYDKRMKPGSTVLLRQANGKYVYVSDVDIYSFSTVKDDPVKHFYSTFGSSHVPYPYLVCEDYTYLLLAKVRISNEDRKTKDPYEQYYNHSGRFDTTGFETFAAKLIHRAIPYRSNKK